MANQVIRQAEDDMNVSDEDRSKKVKVQCQ